MSDLTENLEKIIQKAALDGALTDGAVAQFHSLVQERNALKTDLDDLKKVHENTVINRDALNESLQEARTCAETWAGREQDLMDREGKCTELEIRKECADLRVTDHQEMFKTVFRNSVIRQGVMTPIAGLKQDQYGTAQSPYAQKDDVETEET